MARARTRSRQGPGGEQGEGKGKGAGLGVGTTPGLGLNRQDSSWMCFWHSTEQTLVNLTKANKISPRNLIAFR